MTPYPHIFTPGRIGTMDVKNRLVMPPMGTSFAAPDGTASEKWLQYLERRARGGVGLILTEVTTVSPEGKGLSRQVALYDDRFIPGFRELAGRVHAHQTKVAVQLYHAGRQTTREWNGGAQPVAPSAIASPAVKVQPRELTIEEIQTLVESFAEAARRAKDAGMDAVEIHGAHGYLIGQFLSASANKRQDEYGRNLEGRMRFPLEIVSRVRQKVGKDFPVLFRISAEERVPEGLTLEESKEVALALQATGIDALDVSVGVYHTPGSPGIAPMDVEPGFLMPLAEALKGILRIPVIGVGRINHPDLAEKILAAGRADFLAVGRALLADPDFPAKAAAGQSPGIRRCIACNQGCIDRLFAGKSVACLVNPECGQESEVFRPAPVKKRVLVVGGGPAGLQAAKAAALRGHEVTLWEKERWLGGQFLAAAAAPKKEMFREAVDFWGREAGEAGVKVILGEEATREKVLSLRPDALVAATGSAPLPMEIKGWKNVVNAQDVLLGKEEIHGRKVLVVGGGMVGVEAADFLAERGKQVIVLEMTRHFASGMGPGHWYYVRERLHSRGVEMLRGAVVEEIQEGTALLRVGHEKRSVEDIEAVVLAAGVRPQNELAGQLKGSIAEVQVIGDAREARNALEAVLEGWEAGNTI